MNVYEVRLVKRQYWTHEDGTVDSKIVEFITDWRFMTLKQALTKRDVLFSEGYTPDEIDIVFEHCDSFRDQDSCDYGGTINTITGKDTGH